MPWKWLMFSQVVLLLATAVVALRNIDPAGRWWSIAGAMAALVISIVSIRMWENLYWGMQISAALGLLFAFVSFDQASRYEGTEQDSVRMCSCLFFGCMALVSTGAGIVAMIVACVWLAWVAATQRNFLHVSIISTTAMAAVCFYMLAVNLGAPGGPEVHLPNFLGVVRHALHMFAHVVVDLDGTSSMALWVGSAVAGVATAACWFCLKNRKKSGSRFALLVMIYAVITIFGISWSRMKFGIWQPNAARYYLYVLPLAVGIFIALANSRGRWSGAFTCLLLAVVLINTAVSANKEWGISPYRKGNMQAFRSALCGNRLDAADKPAKISDTQLRRIRVLYCRPEIMK